MSNLTSPNGFRINGISENDGSGWAVNSAEDLNKDGVTDIIIGAILATPKMKTMVLTLDSSSKISGRDNVRIIFITGYRFFKKTV